MRRFYCWARFCALVLLGAIIPLAAEVQDSKNGESQALGDFEQIENQSSKSAKSAERDSVSMDSKDTKSAQSLVAKDGFSHKSAAFAGLGAGYLLGDVVLRGDINRTIQADLGEMKNLSLVFVSGARYFLTKRHGFRYYLDVNVGLGGDSREFAYSAEGKKEPWLLFSVGTNIDYLYDFWQFKGWNLGAFVGVNSNLGYNAPYAPYVEYGEWSYKLNEGYSGENAFYGYGYGFQVGFTLLQDKHRASGLEIGYKWRKSGGSGQIEGEFSKSQRAHYQGGALYLLYLYAL